MSQHAIESILEPKDQTRLKDKTIQIAHSCAQVIISLLCYNLHILDIS
jgi:azurin